MPARIGLAFVTAATLIGWPAASRAEAQAREAAFEVATVKISGPESAAMSIQLRPGGRLVMSNIPLPNAILWAYELEDGRLAGVPKGLDAVRVDVVAKTPDSQPRRGPVQAMMRTLPTCWRGCCRIDSGGR